MFISVLFWWRRKSCKNFIRDYGKNFIRDYVIKAS
jgi:hypothetical protein